MALTGTALYDAVGGFDAILALCRRWQVRCLANPEAAHPFEHELHPQHDERLAAYLAEAFGGPALYTAGYGTETSRSNGSTRVTVTTPSSVRPA